MKYLIRSELLKHRTLRSFLIAFAAAAIAGGLTAIALITTAGHAGNPPLDRNSLSQILHGPYAIVVGAALLLGILGTAGEFRHQTITSTLLAAPRRGRLVTAKVLVHAGLGAALAVVASAVNQAVAIPWLSYQDIPFGGPMDMTRVARRSRRRRGAVRGARRGSRCSARQPNSGRRRERRLAARRGRPRRQPHVHAHPARVAARRCPQRRLGRWSRAGYQRAAVGCGRLCRRLRGCARGRRHTSLHQARRHVNEDRTARIRSRWQGKHGRNGREANSSSISPLWAPVVRMSRPVAAVPVPTRSSTWDTWPRAPPATADVTKPSTRLDSFLSILEDRRYQPGRRETATC